MIFISDKIQGIYMERFNLCKLFLVVIGNIAIKLYNYIVPVFYK